MYVTWLIVHLAYSDLGYKCLGRSDLYQIPQNHVEGGGGRKSSTVETAITLGFYNTVTLDCFSITNTALIKAK